MLDVPGLQHAASLGVNHHGLRDRSTRCFEENTCSARADDPRSPSFRAPAMFSKAMVQGLTRSANVGAGGIQHTGSMSNESNFSKYVQGLPLGTASDHSD